MILDDYFLVLPIYRLNEETYFKNFECDFTKNVSQFYSVEFIQSNHEIIERHKKMYQSSYGGPWEFNEIIGFIKLYFLGSQVRGEYWSTTAQRKCRTTKKQFEYKTHKLHIEVEINELTNESILHSVEHYIEGCKRELKRYHLDLREFNKLKKHIDWVNLYQENNIYR